MSVELSIRLQRKLLNILRNKTRMSEILNYVTLSVILGLPSPCSSASQNKVLRRGPGRGTFQ